jgi:peptidyl-prolyl cis-trans isomerase D
MIPAVQFTDQVKLDSDEVLSYYEENVESFVTEEEIDVEYLSISIGEIAQSIEFSPLDVQKYYDENIERFRSNEERKSSHILVSFENDSEENALEEIKNIDQRIKNGESFEALATEFSDDPGSASNGGDLDWAEPGSFVQEFEQALFSLGNGEISDPIKTQFGYHLIRLDDIKQGRQQNFSEIENELTEEYANVLAKDRLFDVADQLDDLSLQAYNELNSVADALSLGLKQIKSVSRDGTSLLNEQPEFIDILFSPSSLEQSENTPVFEFDDFIIVARVTNHRLPEMKTFEQVEGEITNLLISEKSVDLATSFTQEKMEELTSDSVLNELLEQYDLELQNFTALKRNDNILPKVFLDAIFDAPERDIGRNRYNFVVVDETIYLFSVLQMNPGRLDAFSAEERDGGKIALAEQFGSNEVSSFTKALREKAKVEIDPDLFNSAYDL